MESTRQNKVARLLQKDIGEILQRSRIDLPSGVMITVTKVRVTPDLKIARVYLSLFPTNKPDEIMHEINTQNKQIRYLLGKRIRHQLKEVPELEFFIDDSLDYIDKLDNILKPD